MRPAKCLFETPVLNDRFKFLTWSFKCCKKLSSIHVTDINSWFLITFSELILFFLYAILLLLLLLLLLVLLLWHIITVQRVGLTARNAVFFAWTDLWCPNICEMLFWPRKSFRVLCSVSIKIKIALRVLVCKCSKTELMFNFLRALWTKISILGYSLFWLYLI